MQIARQDFYFNFDSAVKSKDGGLTREILLNELANIILKHKGAVITAVRSSGIEIKDDASLRSVINSIFDNIDENEQLATNLSKLILLKNGGYKGVVNGDSSNSAGDGAGLPTGRQTSSQADKPKKGQQVWQGLGKVSSFLSAVLGSSKVSGENPTREDKNSADRAKVESRAKILEYLQNRGANVGMSTGGAIALGLIVVGAIGTLFYVSSIKTAK